MASAERTAGALAWIGAAAIERLYSRAQAASARARKTGNSTLAAITVDCRVACDPAAVVMAARLEGEDWGLVEQPEGAGSAVVTLGTALRIEADSAERFASVARQWRTVAQGAIADDFVGPAGSGPIAFGGFSFDHRPRVTGPWRGFGSASMVVPTLSFAREGSVTCLTLQVWIEPGMDPEAEVDRALGLLDRCEPAARLSDTPRFASDRARIESALPPEHYEAAVDRAVSEISGGRAKKVVLAREVLVERDGNHDPGMVLSVLRQAFPSCFLFIVGRGNAAFVGASPELLIRREGLTATTVALAGTAPRSADPAVDSHLGERLIRSAKDRSEQHIVTERIAETLSDGALWVSASDEPQLVKVANVQHLATPIRARLREPIAAVELVGRLHPTPAVGGEPWSSARELIAELEGLDRGWYAAPVGWTDTAENGEFVVALRCALLRSNEARCYAGVGVVEGSVGADELVETELKLNALLPIVSA